MTFYIWYAILIIVEPILEEIVDVIVPARAKRGREKKKGMKIPEYKLGLLMSSFIGLVFLFSCVITSVDAAREIPLSVIVEKINQEQVESITIRGDKIAAKLKDGTRLYSKKDPELSLSESLLNLGVSVEKLKKVEIIVKEKEPLAVWFWPVFLFILPLIIFPLWFIALYFLILFGFKILKIERAPKSKIVIYIITTTLLGLLLSYVVSPALRYISNNIVPYLTNFLIYFGIVFLLLKYYFLLSGKKLWQFLLYLIILNLILSGIIILIQLFPRLFL